MLPRVYIDGDTGTVGLRIREWMAGRKDVELVTLPNSLRRDTESRRKRILSSDVSILCLPDDAAREAVSWVKGSNTRIIDASTAHRVAEGWVYGLPELEPGHRDLIRNAKYVTSPGCYATAFILLIRPLIDAGLLNHRSAMSLFALSGYSGGGKSLISKWENAESGLPSLPYSAPYALLGLHKHIPEIMEYSRLITEPHFLPAVGPFRCGMRVQVPIHAAILGDGANASTIREALYARYRGEKFVAVKREIEEDCLHEQSFDPRSCNDTNGIELHVVPHSSGHVLMIALLDNLGKGACGASIQCMNLMLGLHEEVGLP